MLTRKSKRKNRRYDDGHAQDRWLISYADFITLLFAFFVVMYALSTINATKYKEFSKSAETVFTSKVNKKEIKPVVASETSSIKNNIDSLKGHGIIVDGNAERVNMNIESTSFFKTGSAELSDYAHSVLEKLSIQLLNRPILITVEGYTDNIPITGSQYPSNWELSSARAAAVVAYLGQLGINPQKLTAVGYGDQHPIADNKTANGREKNRRVVIVISPNQYRTLSTISPDGTLRAGPMKPAVELANDNKTTENLPIMKYKQATREGIIFTREKPAKESVAP